MPEPTVSVVIPARDDARHLDRCLRALAAQTCPPWEVVVVDNGSTDDTAAVARSHGARVVREPVVGIPAAAATGYDAARGELIARLDADSVPPPDWVAGITTAMAAVPAPDAVTGSGVFHDAPRGLRRPLAAAYLGAYYLLGMAAAGHHVLWGSNMALRREAWRTARAGVHRDEPEVHDDMDLALVLGPGSRIRVLPGLVVGVSARSLVGRAQLRRRFRRAFRTLELNWADLPPWERWAVRLHETAARVRLGGAAQRGQETTMARVVHFEIQAEDVERAKAFYTAAFDWSFEDYSQFTGGQVYWGITTGSSEHAGIDGGLLPRPAPAPGPGQGTNGYVCTMQVEDYDAAERRILDAGGQVALPKAAIPGMAWQGYYLDTEGNTFGIHQADPDAA